MKYIFIILFSFPALANQTLYQRHCTRCHNTNPAKSGVIGPDLVSTPKEVVMSKVITGTYPKEYKPKRKTMRMPKFKLSEVQVESIYWYIQMFKEKK